MVFIGIDQSLTKTAYCIIKEDDVLEFGVFKASKDDGDDHFRANFMINSIKDIVKKYPNAKISLEGLSFGANIGNSSRNLAGLQYVIINHLRYDLNINDISIFAPTSVKKFAIHGKASKKEMVDSLPENVRKLFKDKKYKISTGLHDLTDAYYIARMNQLKFSENLE